MKAATWRKHHKWFGLLLTLFVLMFCVSGIVLNHRESVSSVNVSRAMLPDSYRFRNWNNGLFRSTLVRSGTAEADSILIFGNSGIFATNAAGSPIKDFNKGLPSGADFRQIKGMTTTPDGSLFAAGQFGLYRHEGGRWHECPLSAGGHERLSDVVSRGDTLVVVGRSFLYVSLPPYDAFQRYEVPPPPGYDGKVSLFRTVWLLHSGELFGTVGKLLVDAVALVLIFLCLTGLACWWMPKRLRRLKELGRKGLGALRFSRFSFRWHDRVGRYAFVLLVFVAVTGWSLRPPLLIPLALTDVPALPGTKLAGSNAWDDKLRMLRFDEAAGDWLLSTSDGMYALPSLTAVPQKVRNAPPVSVMGVNVFRQEADGRWLVGSFSGLYRWNRQDGVSTDYFTGERAVEESGPPFGKRAVSGYSGDFGRPIVVEYTTGTDGLPQPEWLSELPMSLWNVAQEVHTGRIYTFLGSIGTLLFIFFAGGAVLWCIITGYRIRSRKKRQNPVENKKP